jgi:hypothetical protein
VRVRVCVDEPIHVCNVCIRVYIFSSEDMTSFGEKRTISSKRW